jgi:PKD repeat protein
MRRNFTINSILIFIILLASEFNLAAQTIQTKDISALFSVKPTVFRGDDVLKEGVMLDMNTQLLSRLYDEAAFSVKMDVPLSYEETVTLQLEKVNILSDGFILRNASGDTLDYTPGIYYRGDIAGHEGFCTVTLFEEHVSGLISIQGKGDFNLGKIKNLRSNDYIIFNDNQISREIPFECHTQDPDIPPYEMYGSEQSDQRYTNCVKVYIEGDYALYLDKGGETPAANYITELFSQIATIYDEESIGIEISEIMVWDQNDCYDQNDAGVALDQFEDNNPTFNGDLAQLFALGGNGTGGLAWVNVLCGWKPYAYENIDSDFNNYPTYSWSVEVVAHELGHNFGSSHTHACVWNGNGTQIDDCGNQWAENNGDTPEGDACYDSANPIIPASGTIMSYCHLLWSVGIDLSNGFGTQPGNLIRNRYNSAGCLTACSGGFPDPPIAEFDSDATEICAGNYLQYYDLSQNNPDTWYWTFEGGDPFESEDQDPWINYPEPGVFDVELEVSNAGGSDYLFFDDYVTVHANPEAFFTYDIVNYSEVNFQNFSDNAVSYYWDFGDGDISFEENPTHIYDSDGTYYVSLYAEHDVCMEDIYTVAIEIISPTTAGMIIPNSSGCAPYSVDFLDDSSPNVTEWNWTFEGGSPATSINQNPTVGYSTPGKYSVSLTVSNSLYSDVITYDDTITVLGPPAAAYTVEIDGSTVSFTNGSVQADSYLWFFGDGQSSTSENPVHQYINSGTFNTQLIATNECGNDTTELEIQISAEANASFSVLDDTICEGETAYFTSTANTQDIQWIFEGGTPSTSTAQNPEVIYSNPGTFMVTQYAYNDLGGDTLQIDNFITVLADPTGNFTANIDAYAVNFTQTISNATSFSWDFGDGEGSTDENPAHTYEVDGSYTVTLTIVGTCNTIVVTKTITIANPPVAAFSYDVTSGCTVLTVQYTNESSVNTDEFLWTFEGGTPSTSTEEHPTVTYETPGVYAVLLQAINEQGQDAFLLDDAIEVLGPPDIGFSYNSNLLTFNFIYEGDPAEFSGWDFGDGTTSTMLNPSHTYASEGVYIVELSATNNCGTSEVYETIEATIKPEANFDFDNNEGCAPLTVNYTDLTTGNPSSIIWLFEGGTPISSTEENPTVIYYSGGEFSTQLIAFSSSGNDTITMEDIIHVNDGPDPDFYFTMDGGTVSFFNQTEGADSYIWNFGDGTASVAENPVHTYNKNGTYKVKLFANNECGQKFVEITITITGVNTVELLLDELKLYPNPNKGQFSIEFELREKESITITVIDLLGKVIDTQYRDLTSGMNKLEFDYSGLPEGFYIIQLDNQKQRTQLKFAIQ